MSELENVRERFLTIMSTKLYTRLEPQELNELHMDLSTYLKLHDYNLTEPQELSLLEMLFYINIFMNNDMDAQIIYKNLKDRLLSSNDKKSAKLLVMEATLLQLNENDLKAIEFLNKLISEEYEYDSDPTSYGLLNKKILSIKFELAKTVNDNDIVMKELIDLIEKIPLDPELWWYLGEVYYKQGKLNESKYCFEEVVLIMPFNYVGFAKIAEILYYQALQCTNGTDKEKLLQDSLNNALRSVELSGLYLKGWSFVAVVSKLLSTKPDILKLATKKIKEIADVSNSRDKIAAEYILNEKSLV